MSPLKRARTRTYEPQSTGLKQHSMPPLDACAHCALHTRLHLSPQLVRNLKLRHCCSNSDETLSSALQALQACLLGHQGRKQMFLQQPGTLEALLALVESRCCSEATLQAALGVLGSVSCCQEALLPLQQHNALERVLRVAVACASTPHANERELLVLRMSQATLAALLAALDALGGTVLPREAPTERAAHCPARAEPLLSVPATRFLLAVLRHSEHLRDKATAALLLRRLACTPQARQTLLNTDVVPLALHLLTFSESCATSYRRALLSLLCSLSCSLKAPGDRVQQILSASMFDPDISLSLKAAQLSARSRSPLLQERALSCVAAIVCRPTPTSTFLEAAGALALLVDACESRALRVSDCVPALAGLLRVGVETKMALAICSALTALCASCEENRDRLVANRGALVWLSNIIDCRSSSACLLVAVTRIIRNLARSRRSKAAVTLFNADKLMQMLRENPNVNERVRIEACGALANIAANLSSVLNTGFSTERIKELVLMTRDMSNAEVRARVCCTLKNLTFRSDPNLKAAVIELLSVKGLRKWLQDPQRAVRVHALGLLRNLLRQRGHRTQWSQANLQSLLHDVEQCFQRQDVRHDTDEAVEALRTLTALAAGSKTCKKLICSSSTESGALGIICSQLINRDQEGCRIAAVWCIGNLLTKLDVNSAGSLWAELQGPGPASIGNRIEVFLEELRDDPNAEVQIRAQRARQLLQSARREQLIQVETVE